MNSSLCPKKKKDSEQFSTSHLFHEKSDQEKHCYEESSWSRNPKQKILMRGNCILLFIMYTTMMSLRSKSLNLDVTTYKFDLNRKPNIIIHQVHCLAFT